MDPVSSSEIEDTRIPTSIEVADQFTRRPFLHEQHKGWLVFHYTTYPTRRETDAKVIKIKIFITR